CYNSVSWARAGASRDGTFHKPDVIKRRIFMDPNIKISAEPVDAQRCKFTVDRPVYPDGAAFFGDQVRAQNSPLAEKILAIPDALGVLIAENQVTVTTANPTDDWLPIARQIGALIRAQLQSGVPAVSDAVKKSLPSPKDIQRRVQEILDTEINPG